MGWHPNEAMPWHRPIARQDGRCDACGAPLDPVDQAPRRRTFSIGDYRYHEGCNAQADRLMSERLQSRSETESADA